MLPVPFGSKKVDYSWHFWQRGPQDAGDIAALFGQATEANIAALFGCPSGGLFGLDCDDPRSFTETEARLAGLGVTTWTVQSNCTAGHVGGGTYLLRAPGPVKSSGLVRGQGEYSIVWGTHPSGSTYAIAHADKPIWTLPVLDALPWLKLKPADPEPGKPKRIPRLAWRLLQGDSAAVGKYSSRSEAEAALVASLIRAGYAFDEVAHLLIMYPGPGKFAEKYAAKPKMAMDYLRQTHSSAVEYLAKNESGAAHKAEDLIAWAESCPWPGRTGATDRAVFVAHCRIVQRCGHEPYGASVRELAELCGMSWMTVLRANYRLAKAGLLTQEAQAIASLSQQYRLPFTAQVIFQCCVVLHSVNPPVTECNTMQQQNDTFRWAGLGKSGLDVWRILQGSPDGVSVSDIAQATGRDRSTIHRKLTSMFRLGMAEPLGDGLWRSLPGADLEEAARELGTFGAGQAQRVRHERDRRRHRTALDFRRKVKEARANRS